MFCFPHVTLSLVIHSMLLLSCHLSHHIHHITHHSSHHSSLITHHSSHHITHYITHHSSLITSLITHHSLLITLQDMWSLGILLYVILAGELPFDTNTLSQQILSASISFDTPLWRATSPEAKDLISRLVVVDPSQRLTVEQALQHPWIVNVCLTHTHHP